MTYSDVQRMQTGKRRWWLYKGQNDAEKQREALEEMRNNASRGGKKTISGETLKNRMKNNQIPN
jgi:hypothetical protein